MAKFAFKSSYMNCVWFTVSDSTGHYEAELRLGLSDYEAGIYNGNYQADCAPMVGFMRATLRQIPIETVRAFNAWQKEKTESALAKMDAAPERYGIIPPDDSMRIPMQAKGAALYIGGAERWQFEFAQNSGAE